MSLEHYGVISYDIKKAGKNILTVIRTEFPGFESGSYTM